MIFISSLLWIVSLLFILYIQAFHPILRENSSKYTKYRTSKKGKVPNSIFQTRQGVSKDLWISSETQRTHYHLESPSSFLQFNPDLTETFSQIKFWMNDNKSNTHIQSKTASLLLKKNPSFIFENGVNLTNSSIQCTTDNLVYDIKDGSLKGVGKVVFTLQSDDVWKKKTS